MKIGCFIFSDHLKYKKLHECAIKSFSIFHPDVKIFSYTHEFKLDENLKKFPVGISRLILAKEIFEKQELDKIIILGADTITCSRLDEFIDNNQFDILTTLDYPYRLSAQNLYLSNNNQDHVNADVLCFNNIKALDEVIRKCFEIKTEYFEQGALNYVCNIQNKFTNKIIDGDYENSNIVYNARSKGNLIANANSKPWFKYTNLFKVQNNKLYTNVHENCFKSKQIKVWHYCDGLGTLNNFQFEQLINNWIKNGFNQETKDFFSNQCNCGDFFKQSFII